MEITYTNKSLLSNQDITSFVEFLSGCFGQTDMPVHITFRSKHHTGVSGYAYFPTMLGTLARNPKGRYNVSVIIGTDVGSRAYPYKLDYKKRAGEFYVENAVESILHVIAHELRHVEQFAATRNTFPAAKQSMSEFKKAFKIMQERYPSGSAEVDAELVSFGLIRAYRTYLENSRKAA